MRRTFMITPMLALAALAAPLSAQDFSTYASPFTTEYQATYGNPLVEGDFEFYAVFGSDGTFNSARNALGTWGNDSSDPGYINNPENLGSSTAMYGTTTGAWVDMTGVGSNFGLSTAGPVFSLFSIDVAHLFARSSLVSGNLDAFNLTFYACPVISCSTFLTQTFTISARPVVGGDQVPRLQKLIFNTGFQNVQRVAWQQAGSTHLTHQFTNVQGAIIPEPSTYVLVATGLVMVAGAARRRRAA